MFAIPWYVALFVSFPENVLMILVGFALFNLEIGNKHVFLVSAINALVIYIVRQLPIVFGLHTFVSIFTIIFLIIVFTKKHFWQTIIAVLTGFMMMGIMYSVWMPIFFVLTSTNTSVLADYPVWNVIGFIPMAAVLFMIYLLIRKHRLFIYKF
ncbi:MAG: hypothetical protein ACOX0E_01710 [Syntrophomonadaceae bacterium]|jgi:hypothetical protein